MFSLRGLGIFLSRCFIQSIMLFFLPSFAASLSLTPLYKQPPMEIRYTYALKYIQV